MSSIPGPEYRYLRMIFEVKIATGHTYIINGQAPTQELEEVMEAIENNYTLLELSP
jgi:frataxin-like iron-binding protein CyaY